MDLLAGYGSDAGESDDGSPQPLQQQRPVAAPGAAPACEPPTAAEPGKLLAGLPPPSTAQRPLFSGLPKPAARQPRKIVARFRVPINFGPAPDVALGSSDEEVWHGRGCGSVPPPAARLPPRARPSLSPLAPPRCRRARPRSARAAPGG